MWTSGQTLACAHTWSGLANIPPPSEVHNLKCNGTYAALRPLTHTRALGHMQAILIRCAPIGLRLGLFEVDASQNGHCGVEMLALRMVLQRTRDAATLCVLNSSSAGALSHMSRHSLTTSHTV